MRKEIFHFESPAFLEKTKNQIGSTYNDLSEPEEKHIASVIMQSWIGGYKITQRQIALSSQWIGLHPKWEEKAREAGFVETSTRRVREIIRNLRVKRGMPILSDCDGYFFPFTSEDAPSVLRRIESEVYSRNKSSLETYRELQKCFNTNSEFMDGIEEITTKMEGRLEKVSVKQPQQHNKQMEMF